MSSNKQERQLYPRRKLLSQTFSKIINDNADKIDNIDKLWKALSTEDRMLLKELYFWYFWDRRNHSARDFAGEIESSRSLQLFSELINPESDKIVSFNYDIMLEEAITFRKHEEFQYSYGFDEIKPNIIGICKPMGGVNWLVFEKGKQIYWKEYIKGEWVERSGNIDNVIKRIRKISDLSGTHALYETRVYTEIKTGFAFRPSIFGNDAIVEEYPEFSKNLWERTIKYIKECEELFVIGFDSGKGKDGSSPKISEMVAEIHKHKKAEFVNPEPSIDAKQRTFSDWILENQEFVENKYKIVMPSNENKQYTEPANFFNMSVTGTSGSLSFGTHYDRRSKQVGHWIG